MTVPAHRDAADLTTLLTGGGPIALLRTLASFEPLREQVAANLPDDGPERVTASQVYVAPEYFGDQRGHHIAVRLRGPFGTTRGAAVLCNTGQVEPGNRPHSFDRDQDVVAALSEVDADAIARAWLVLQLERFDDLAAAAGELADEVRSRVDVAVKRCGVVLPDEFVALWADWEGTLQDLARAADLTG